MVPFADVKGKGIGRMPMLPSAIQKRILLVNGMSVIFDSDLARLYGVETKVLNQGVSRNQERFPEDFSFKLSVDNWENLKCQSGTSSFEHGGRRKLPRVFTEHGLTRRIVKSDSALEGGKGAL